MTATNLAPTKKGFPAGIREERLDEIRLLLDTRRQGFSLEAPFYTDDRSEREERGGKAGLVGERDRWLEADMQMLEKCIRREQNL